MSKMREWFLAGMAACLCALAGCANPEPAAPPKPQIMNGFYIEKSPKSAPQHPKPGDTTTASQPVLQPVAAPASEPQPAPVAAPSQPQPAPMAPVPPSNPAPGDASQFIEPPSR